MPHTVNLKNYFTRIGYTGPQEPTLEVLQQLHALHPRSIPFENLNPLTRRRGQPEPRIDRRKTANPTPRRLLLRAERLIRERTEPARLQNHPITGPRTLGARTDAIPPRTHMVLRIDSTDQRGEAWIADVGFGSVTLIAPLRLIPGTAQPTQLGSFRLADASHNALYLEVQAATTPGPASTVRPASGRMDRLRNLELVHLDLTGFCLPEPPDRLPDPGRNRA